MATLKLFRHQEVALAHMRTHSHFALFMEQGTSKTLPAILRILELLKKGNIKNALVVAPIFAMGAWERDVDQFLEPGDQEIIRSAMTVINYDKVWRKPAKKANPFDKTWGCIVLDESHFIKNRTSKRADFLLKLATKAKYRYILTGTPIGNGQLENIWSQFCFLDPYLERGKPHSRIFGGSYYKFQDRYCILNQYFQPNAYKHVNELQEIISEHSYRVTKDQCLDLPDKLPDEIIKVDLKEPKLYKDMHQTSAILEHEILAENPLTRMLKLRQISSGFLTDNDGKLIRLQNEKLTVLDELMDSLDKKVVIFAEFKFSIASISELLTKKKINHVTLDGDQKDKQVWRKFQTDEKIRVIICQYQSGNAGIDLFASDTIIYYEPTLRSNILEQSRDRIHRTGQTSKCSYLHLITKGTIEAAIYKALAGYSDFSERLFNDYMTEYQRGYNKGR